MLDDLHPSCLGVGHIVPRSHQKTSPLFALLPDILHLIIVAAVLFLYLFYYQLRVSSDEKSLNAELLG
jgi:hypothetical protein